MVTARRFQSTVTHYLKGRPPYAALLIRRVAELVNLGPGHGVLDLGCGPGQLARAFAPFVREVVAMDPEPAMLEAAQTASAETASAETASAGFSGIRFVSGGSADLSPAIGRFHLVVMGRSFHWMDRAETLRRLDALIEPGGGVALFHTEPAAVPLNAWHERYDAVRRRYAGEEPDRGEPWVRYEAFLLASPFSLVEERSAFEQQEVDGDTLIHRVLSMSTTSPERLGCRVGDLKREIEALVREVAPKGRLPEVIKSTALVGLRPGEH